MVPREQLHAGIEGDIDTAHVNFLHMDYRPDAAKASDDRLRAPSDLFRQAELHPRLTAMDTEYGMVYGGRRRLPDGNYYWRVTQWMLPSFSLIPGKGRRGGTAWIPVDDEHCTRYSISLSQTRTWTWLPRSGRRLAPRNNSSSVTARSSTR
jgi:hypothetical protein